MLIGSMKYQDGKSSRQKKSGAKLRISLSIPLISQILPNPSFLIGSAHHIKSHYSFSRKYLLNVVNTLYKNSIVDAVIKI